MAVAFARGALRLPTAAPLGLAARPQGAAAAHIVRRGASIGLVAARPHLARPQLCATRRGASLGLGAARPPLARPQLCATFATTSGDDDDQNRSLDALGDDFFERARLEDRGNQRATPAGDLQYAGERPGNWEELLAEAEASYPERAGPRRSKHLKREARSGVARVYLWGRMGGARRHRRGEWWTHGSIARRRGASRTSGASTTSASASVWLLTPEIWRAGQN